MFALRTATRILLVVLLMSSAISCQRTAIWDESTSSSTSYGTLQTNSNALASQTQNQYSLPPGYYSFQQSTANQQNLLYSQYSQSSSTPSTQSSFMPPTLLPFGENFTPWMDLPCGPDAAGIWNAHCDEVHRTLACQPLDDTCVNFGQPLLTKAQAQVRIAWVNACFSNNQPVMQQMQMARGPKTASGIVCPEYPAMGYLDQNNNPVYWAGPTESIPKNPDGSVNCGRPVAVFPVKYCTSQLQ